jgi:hypothetical protein
MPKFNPSTVAHAASKIDEGELTASRIVKSGVSGYAVTRAIAEGYLATTKQTVRTGQRGRPAAKLKLTPKGKRAAAK